MGACLVLNVNLINRSYAVVRNTSNDLLKYVYDVLRFLSWYDIDMESIIE